MIHLLTSVSDNFPFMSTTFSTDSDQTFSFFWINFTCTSVQVSG